MKLNVSYPATGCQKLFEVVDEHKIRMFYEKRMGAELDANPLGDEWKGYVLKITGGNDKQGFPMKQGVLTNGRVRLLLSKGHSCYRPRRTGERKRKSVRGCIVDANLSVLALVIVRKGEQEIPGLTDTTVPRRLGPKRASRIRKLFNLTKDDDVRQYVVKRPLPQKDGKKQRCKAPKIQRLITPTVLQRKRHRLALKKKRCIKRKEQADSYAKLLAQRRKELKAKRLEAKRRRSASLREIEYDVYNDLILAAVLTREHEAELLIPNIGKTFTIVGTSEEPGIIPRSLEYLFRTLPTLPEVPLIKPNASGGISYMTEDDCLKDKMDRQILLSKHKNVDCALHKQTYKAMQDRLSNEPVGLIDQPLGPDVMLNVWVSFAEIYNENIYDLLKPHPCKGQSRQKLCLGNVNGDTYIKGLTSISVSSGLEAYLILQYGLHNTKNAATSVNSQSSSSHCVFTLKIAQASTTNKEEFVSVFNFCDLAGSERIKKTQNVGDRLKESNSINTSLLVLGRCIKLIRDNQKLKTSKVIPFRESKLTQLLQKALLGYESVWMIVNINTCREMFEETQHVLQFSAIAKDVVVEQQMLKACRTKKASELLDTQIDKMNVKELQEQIAFCQTS
ncbi:hypothetical protein RN001_008616 [Aquatica leii]|uniref:Kinesin-like protein n=1 Tax=Aquatica leii TaxID=1421715 RepID=A0AAN7SRF0_9COLE|nr:hypothetical protein RN001_008616 [Aquatica leii]